MSKIIQLYSDKDKKIKAYPKTLASQVYMDDGTTTINSQMESKANKTETYTKKETDDRIATIPKGDKGDKGEAGTASVAIDDNVTNVSQTWTSKKISDLTYLNAVSSEFVLKPQDFTCLDCTISQDYNIASSKLLSHLVPTNPVNNVQFTTLTNSYPKWLIIANKLPSSYIAIGLSGVNDSERIIKVENYVNTQLKAKGSTVHDDMLTNYTIKADITDNILKVYKKTLGGEYVKFIDLNISSYIPSGFNVNLGICNVTGGTGTISDVTTTSTVISTVKDKVLSLENIINNTETTPNRFANLIWSAYGDSITAPNTYQTLVKDYLGLKKVNNCGLSGRLISQLSGHYLENKSFCVDVNSIPLDSDIITVWGGVNDFGNGAYGSGVGIPLGSETSTNTYEFYGALNVLVNNLYTRFKGKKIAFILTTRVNDTKTIINPANNFGVKNGLKPNSLGITLEQYMDAIKKVCIKNSIPYLDLYNQGGLCEYNLDLYTLDGLHPNDDGYEFLVNKISEFIKKL